MPVFTVKTRIVFEGDFQIQADDATQASEYVEQHCGLVLGGDIHTTLRTDTEDWQVDWQFPVHPTKEIISVEPVEPL